MERVLIADDVDYYRRSREVFIKPSEMPQKFNTPIKYGCPYDCGLCPDHEQHSCLTLVELGDHCNLSCPVCYAESGPHRESFHSFETVVADARRRGRQRRRARRGAALGRRADPASPLLRHSRGSEGAARSST